MGQREKESEGVKDREYGCVCVCVYERMVVGGNAGGRDGFKKGWVDGYRREGGRAGGSECMHESIGERSGGKDGAEAVARFEISRYQYLKIWR